VIGSCGEDYIPTAAERIATWRKAHFPPSWLSDPALEASVWGDLADPSGGGVPNRIRFYLNEDPLAPPASPSIEFMLDGSDLVYRFSRIQGLPANYGRVEWSSDLQLWSGAGLSHSVLSSGGGVERVETRLPLQPAGSGSAFMRLNVSP
jgi:hypothetical protein